MKIYATGRAFIDYFTPLQMEACGKNGSPHISANHFDFLLQQIKKNSSENLLQETGGSVCNTAKTMAYLGHNVTFVGTIGIEDMENSNHTIEKVVDEEGNFFLATIKKYGVTPHLSFCSGKTGRCLVAKTFRGYEVVAACPGVAPEIKVSQLDLELIQQSDWIIVEGMDLDKPEFSSIIAEQYFKRNSAMALCCGTSFGARSTANFILNNAKQHIHKSNIPPVIIFANDAEAQIMESTGVDIAALSKDDGRIFVVTHGCGGSSAYINGKRLFQESSENMNPQKEPTGAGDVFAAFFLHSIGNIKSESLLTTETISQALKQASKGASLIVNVPLCNIQSAICNPFN
ncbi:MAG: carbohydrate kinase family protein [Spirochaetaceae bacterium]|nr:carbohydrate kinase family protein [Spirochaetaceae bacterium]